MIPHEPSRGGATGFTALEMGFPVTGGPYLEGKEHIGGFLVVD